MRSMNDVKELESLTDTQSRQEIVEDISDMALPITTHAIERNFPKTSKVNKLLLNKTNKQKTCAGGQTEASFILCGKSYYKIIVIQRSHQRKCSQKKKKNVRKGYYRGDRGSYLLMESYAIFLI